MTTNMPSNSQSGKSAPPRGEHSTRVRADDGQEREEAREAGQTDKRPSPPWLPLFPLSPFSCRIWILVRLRPPDGRRREMISSFGVPRGRIVNTDLTPDGRREGGRDAETEHTRPPGANPKWRRPPPDSCVPFFAHFPFSGI